MPLAAGTRVGPHEIATALGEGGMGEVYRARDTWLGRDVAVKVLPLDIARDPERRARFEREAIASSADGSQSSHRGQRTTRPCSFSTSSTRSAGSHQLRGSSTTFH